MGNVNLSLKISKMKIRSPVVILGCTGTGKSKLAIELAKTFNGEIISADSMQVYKGLDIITNKVTPAEQLEAVHHFISCTDPLNRYTVVDFRNKALPLIECLMKQNKLPIIVGGTNYYIESLLWDNLIVAPSTSGDKLLYEKDMCYEKIDPHSLADDRMTVEQLLKYSITQDTVESISSEVLHEMLKNIDPVMADSLHPQDRRKVIRSLQVFQQHGCRHSDLLSTQRSQNGGSSLGGPLRYKKSVMLWLQCEKNVLEERLDERLGQMVEVGLIDELLAFHKHYNEKRMSSDMKPKYVEGIFQSIGFKEFHDFLIISDEERKREEGEKIRQEGIEQMRLVTKQYAKKQVKWIKNRFLRKSSRQVPPIYGLDATDVSLWQKNVLCPATHIVQAMIDDVVPEIAPLPIEDRDHDDKITYYCDVCDLTLIGTKIWQVHMNSKRHSRRKASIAKKLKNEPCEKKHTVNQLAN